MGRLSLLCILVLLCLMSRGVVVAQTAGDTCATAGVISANGSYPFNTTGASGDDPCAASIPTVWYRFTAPANGTVNADLCGSSFDTYLTAFSGASCPASCSGIVAENNNICGTASAISFAVTTGTTYHFAVSGNFSSDFGAGVFNFAFLPNGDTCGDAIEVTSGSSTPFDLSLNNAGDDPCDGPSYRTQWFRYTAPANGRVTADTCGSSFDTNLQGFIADGCPVTCEDRILGNNDACGLQSIVGFDMAQGDTAYFVVGGWTPGDAGPGVFNLVFEPVEGGEFCNTAGEVVFDGTYPFDTTGAPDRDPCFSPALAVWYRYTAPDNGTVAVDLCGSSFNTWLTLFSADACPVPCANALIDNDNSCGSQSAVTLNMAAGQSILICVAGSDAPDFGPGVMNIAFTPTQAGDTCAVAGVITGNGTYPFDTTGASSDDPCVIFGPIETVWYRFTAPDAGRVFADLCGSSYDTYLTAFTAEVCPVPCVSEVEGNNDACGEQSALAFDSDAGSSFFLCVSGSSVGDFGPGVLNFRFVPHTLGDLTYDGVLNVADVTELGRRLLIGDTIPLAVGDVNSDAVVDDLDVEALAASIVND